MFDTKAEEVRIATAFLERVYRAKAQKKDALMGFWDEADLFAPQKPGPDETRLLHNAEAIVGRGRIRRLGTTLITQRPAILNKNVLTQTDVLIALRITGPRDRAAVDEWVKGNAQGDERAELIGSLAGLKLGEAWVYGPGEDPPLYQRVRVRERRTFNSSATGGAKKAQPQALAHVGGRDRQGRHALLAHRGRKSRARARRPQTGPCRGISKPRSRALSFGSSKAARGRATPTASLPPTPKTSTSTRSTSGAAL